MPARTLSALYCARRRRAEGPRLLHLRGLHRELGLDRLAADGEPLLLDAVAVLQLVRGHLRES